MLKKIKDKFNNDPMFLVSVVGKCTAIFLFALMATLATMDSKNEHDNVSKATQSQTVSTSIDKEQKNEEK